MNNDNQNPGQNLPGDNNPTIPATPPASPPQWPAWPQPDQNASAPQVPVENQIPPTPPTVIPTFTPPVQEPAPIPPQNDLSTNPFLTTPPSQTPPSPPPAFATPPAQAPSWPPPTFPQPAQPIQPSQPANYDPQPPSFTPSPTSTYDNPAPQTPQENPPMDFANQPAPYQPQNPPQSPLPDQNWANQALNAPPTDLSNLQAQPQTPPLQDQSYSMQGSQPSTNFTTSGNTQFSNTTPLPQPVQTPPPVEMPEPAPTDLSQLTTTVTDQTPRTDIYNPVVSSPENLNIPTTSSPNNNPAQESKPDSKIPKIAIIIAGIVLLLLVTGASAYFILGIGQTQTTTPPATQNTNQPPLTNPPAPLPKRTVATPAPGTTTGETDNTDFGALGGSKPQSTSSAKPQSAAEILRQQTQK